MGEVYRARDTRLERIVAVKVLPRDLSDDEAFRRRFDREARALSSLTHPHICAVYDVGRHEETHYLVMEYMEGETLAERLERGPLSLEEIVRHGVEIAAALDAAHREGIVHRDLKPANVILTKNGAKLVDFGLARWGTTPQILRSRAGGTADLTADPRQRVTEDGTLLGTVHYMAPEQLEGRRADSRSDIFSFGGLLYEMATGRAAFDGVSTAGVIAAILERQPPSLREVRPDLPPVLERIVRACLAKNPDERVQTAHDLMLQLQWLGEGQGPASNAVKRMVRRRGVPLLGAPAAALLVLAVVLAVLLVRACRPREAVRVAIPPPSGASFRYGGDNAGPAAISPDGRMVVFSATDHEGTSLWIRPLAGTRATKIARTTGAKFPFWSPDSKSVAFFASGRLKRVEAIGGPPLDLAEAPDGRGGAWNGRGQIVFAPDYGGGLLLVSAAGGAARPLTRLASGHTTHRWPAFIGDDRVVYVAANHDPALRDRTAAFLVPLDGGAPRRLMSCESQVRYANGAIFHVRGGTLYSQKLSRGDVPRDLPRAVAENVFADDTTWSGAFSLSSTGTIVHHAATAPGTQLAWFDRTGTLLGRLGERAIIDNVRLSPDGERVAVNIGDVVSNVWIFDAATGQRRRLTWTASADMIPIWSPDGRTIAFSSARGGAFDLYSRSADGTGTETPLLQSPLRKVASDWSRDGRYLVFNHREPSSDIWLLPLEGDRTPRPFIDTPADEYSAQFSPDGRWLAYTSHETGRGEIYVTTFPNAGPRWQISTGGGRVARWRGDGRELYYLGPDNRLTAVELRPGRDAPEIVASRTLFVAAVKEGGLTYDVSRDGSRFLLDTVGDAGLTPLNVILNWR